jgi:hypothetical protein
MKKIIRLTESDLARIVKRIINESTPPDKVKFDDLIGKTVKFVADPELTVYINEEGKEYTKESFENEPFGDYSDSTFWDYFNNSEVKGIIKDMHSISTGEAVFIDITDLGGYNILSTSIIYECGTKRFEIELKISKNLKGFFSGGKIIIFATNKKLSENLENRLPCGNFDFAMNKSNNNDFA